MRSRGGRRLLNDIKSYAIVRSCSGRDGRTPRRELGSFGPGRSAFELLQSVISIVFDYKEVLLKKLQGKRAA